MVQPQMEAKGLSFDVLPPCAADLGSVADRDRVQQILLNLLTNATKFTQAPRAGGTFGAYRPIRRYASMSQDTGVGIAAEALEAVFDPVRSGGPPIPPPGAERGVGLGLAISRDLAEAMCGTLEVQSAAG